MENRPVVEYDLELWAELSRLAARYGGVPLPAPTDEGHCDDCHAWGTRFTRGKVAVCFTDYCRRARAAGVREPAEL